ncbi:MAG: sigma 54-interacting transcriptional regulator [Porphyromonadaceae bacterium]|nr:sigma 54-interacting transcriptional regulator [Porphyromonadaceae bacterium]
MNVDIQQIKQRFGIIGSAPLLLRAIQVAVQVAPTDMSVLIMGESGVGKESFPRIIHQYSTRKHGPYIAVNCGAIPEGTIDSELFGHLKGSFTGAMGDRKGYFQEADGGTIFLDEVGELPLSTQARLLRVLEVGEFIPVGASQPLRTNVRIVAATNVNLREAVDRGRFREDLLFRLNTVPIEVPPLRKRTEDINLLFRYFAAQVADKYNMPPLRLDDDAVRLLQQYYWPGNIRELRNLTDRISVLEEERQVTASTIEKYLPASTHSDYHPALRTMVSEASTSTSAGLGDREAVLHLLLEMKQEMSDLRKLVGNIMQGKVKIPGYADATVASVEPIPPIHQPIVSQPTHSVEELSSYLQAPSPSAYRQPHRGAEDIEVQVVDASPMEEGRSLEEVERNMIIAALARHSGKRRPTAEELKISERTLYRKIKEYGLDV